MKLPASIFFFAVCLLHYHALAADPLQPGAVGTGTFAQPDMAPYPMILTVTARRGNVVYGTLRWPTLRNSRSRFQGVIHQAARFTFVEYEVIQGTVGVPTVYQATIIGDHIAGTGQYANITGTFQLHFPARGEPTR